MKIGLVCPYDLFSKGGVREHVLALYGEFKKGRHQVKIIAPATKKPANPDFLLLGWSVRFPSVTGSWGRISACWEEEKIKKILEEEKFDLLHFHEPLVPFLSWQILLTSQVPHLATFHSAWENSLSLIGHLDFLIKPFAETFSDKLTGLVAVSSTSKKGWQKFFSQKMKIIPNGIDLNRFHPHLSPFEKYQDGKINLLFVGRLEKRKGAIYLLKALEKMKEKNLRLILVGNGPRKIELELFSKTHRLPEVELAGQVKDEDLPRFYATADIACFPSLGGESFGLVLLEAMASGLPIVCFANPGYQEVLKNYPFQEGLVEVKDIQGLAASLKKLIHSESLRRELGQWGRREAEKYAWPKIADQILAYYQKIVTKR